MGSLTKQELRYLEKKLLRKANTVEKNIVSAEWSEHCSYKSSKKFIRNFPTQGSRVIAGPGYDAGVIDIGGGRVLTVHIESHNHPSAVDPHGGAATGVGGVLRDIISMGTRPIAVLDALRFAPVRSVQTKSTARAKWLFRNVVKGIADYGNCVGVPTVGGEIEFDASFDDYCLVDVISIGYGSKKDLLFNSAATGDLLILAGGSTGRDGLHGAAFASKTLQSDDRSAVQIPDPFMEKLLIEAIMEAVAARCLKAIKDLGGGGLSCCLSETSDSLDHGFEVELSRIRMKERGMTASELMISESQERMLFIADPSQFDTLKDILEKYELPYSIIGIVRDHKDLDIRFDNNTIAKLPSRLVAHAPFIRRPACRPSYLNELRSIKKPTTPQNMEDVLLSLLSEPTIASKSWVYEQFDNEVGIRTVTKPGECDAAVLKLDDGKFVSVKLDGNSKQCYVDPYRGSMGCLSEGYRNVICSGATPVGIVDHLQFASPENPEVFWTFKEVVNSIVHYCTGMQIAVVGGKVSFYNETSKGPIKPSPVIGTLGIIDSETWITRSAIHDGSVLFIVGETRDEMGGSEYYESFHSLTGGHVPSLRTDQERAHANAVSSLIRAGLVECAHDCSKGGIGIAVAEMAIVGRIGISVNADAIPKRQLRLDELLFSETNSRYLLGTKYPEKVRRVLLDYPVTFGEIGVAGGTDFEVTYSKSTVLKTPVSSLQSSFESLNKIMQ